MPNIPITVKTKYDGKGIKSFQRDAQKSAKAIASTYAKLGGFIGGALLGAAAKFGKESIELFREQARVEAQLAATLQSTQHAAGLTADELKRMASELQGVTNFGDEATIAGQNMLLTFTNIGSSVFPRATAAMQDLSTAMGTDLKQSAIQIGKALNDPIRGLDNLSRSGIQFSNSQKETIRTLVESGRRIEAQGLILEELEKQFGGSAKAAREADGNFIAAGNALGDLQEAIGEGLVAEMSSFNELVIESAEGWIVALDNVGLLRDAIQDLAGISGELSDQQKKDIEGTQAAMLLLTDPVEALSIGFGRIQRGLERAITPAANDLAATIVENTVGAEAFSEALTVAATEANKVEDALSGAGQGINLEDFGISDKEAEHLEKVKDIRRDFARDLIEIDEEAQDDIDDTWEDFFDDEEKLWKDHQKSIANIRKQAAKDDSKAQKDFSKSLAKINQDEAKQIQQVQKKSATNQRLEQRRKQIDTLGDERLFQLSLRQMAAEGDAIGIAQALERRSIEEDIAREKAQVENEIENEKQGEDIRRIQETAAEKRAELEIEKQEEAAIRKQELAEKLADEQESFEERKAELRDYRDNKLKEIEQSRLESVEKLGQELADMDELTRKELKELGPVAGKLGEDVGKSFADGMQKGFEQNRTISNLLSGGKKTSSAGAGAGFGANPNTIGFAEGGTIPGPLGSPQFVVAHGGETITPPGQTPITLNATINASGGVSEAMIKAMFQDFVDNTLAPALS